MSKYQGQGKRMSRRQRVHVYSYKRGYNKSYKNYGTHARILKGKGNTRTRQIYRNIKASGKAKRYVNRFR